MLIAYIDAAMHKATYEILEDGTFYGEIADCPGVWSSGETLEACRDNVQDALQGWIILGLRLRHVLPVIDDIDLNMSLQEAA